MRSLQHFGVGGHDSMVRHVGEEKEPRGGSPWPSLFRDVHFRTPPSIRSAREDSPKSLSLYRGRWYSSPATSGALISRIYSLKNPADSNTPKYLAGAMHCSVADSNGFDFSLSLGHRFTHVQGGRGPAAMRPEGIKERIDCKAAVRRA